MVKTVFLCLICWIFLVGAQNADGLDTQIQLHTYLEKNRVPLNREVVYHVELSWTGELSRFQIVEAVEPVVTNLKLRGSGSSNRFYTDEDGQPYSIKRITYYFLPKEMGMAYIDGVTVKYQDNLTNEKNILPAQRLGAEITEPLPEESPGIAPANIVIFILAGLFVVILIFFLWRYFQQRKAEKARELEKPLSPEQKYLDRMKDTIDPESESTRKNFEILSKLLQRYLTEKYQLQDSALNYDVIREKLEQDGIDKALLEKLKLFYDRSELSKYAGEEITVNEFHLFYDTVELLLKRLKENRDENQNE